MRLRTRIRIFALAGAFVAMSANVNAQGWAVRGGANVNPDQMYVGGAYELVQLGDDLWFTPSADVGFGDGVRLFAGNLDLMYRLWKPRRGPWHLDVGGGPTINHYRFGGYSETEAGVNAVAALKHARGWSTEFRVGFMDSPEFRFGVGYAWGHRR